MNNDPHMPHSYPVRGFLTMLLKQAEPPDVQSWPSDKPNGIVVPGFGKTLFMLSKKSFQVRDTFIRAITPAMCSRNLGCPYSGENHWW